MENEKKSESKHRKTRYIPTYNPNVEEHWEIRWDKNSPCYSCKTFHCSELNPVCSRYRIFLNEQLTIKEEKFRKHSDILCEKDYNIKHRFDSEIINKRKQL